MMKRENQGGKEMIDGTMITLVGLRSQEDAKRIATALSEIYGANVTYTYNDKYPHTHIFVEKEIPFHINHTEGDLERIDEYLRREPIVMLVNGEKELKTLKTDAEKESEKEEKSLSHYLRKEARIITEVQEILANEIKARLSSDGCTISLLQLVEPLAKLRIKG
ncbi:hypothetical protein [Mogibacterium diversum]|nr:hypothetical protein [Mogibacterium diversum]